MNKGPSHTTNAASSGARPKRLHLSMGGFHGGYYELEMNGGRLLFSPPGDELSRTEISPTASDWATFRKTIDSLKLWIWREDYLDPNVCDGAQWSVLIDYSDRRIKANGSNAYPDEDGNPRNEMTEIFRGFLRAVEDLMGGRRFG